jgi:hypothetical protein
MSTIAAAVKHMLAAGMSAEAIVAAVEEMETGAQLSRTARQERNARYYEARKERLKSSENKTLKTVSDGSDAFKTIKTLSDAEPRARVRDITSNSENNHQVGVVVSASAPVSDDWPDGNAHRHAALIVAEVASPWLDPHKSPGLVATEGQIAAWKAAGASWQFDVLAVVRASMAKRRQAVGSWRWFRDAVAQSIADNRAAMAIPEATVIPIRPGTGPPTSRDEKISASWDYAIEKIANEQSQN